MALQHKEITSLCWDGQAWRPLRGDIQAGMDQPSSTFRLATMNILTDTFPWPVRLAIASGQRFERLILEIAQLDATVLGLNEVSRTSLEVLLSSAYVRSTYHVTELPTNVNTTLDGPHGCVLLSKLPFEACYALELQQTRKPVVGVVQVAGRRVAICSLHTTAYQTPQNMALRARQISDAVSFLRSLEVQAQFLMGDLNMHYVAEDGVLGTNGMLDCWAETHFGADGDGHPGYTFDAVDNAMIPRYIPGESRRMRLDRILCCEGGAFVPAHPCTFWGHKAVDAARDLYLSDHYGLVVDLAVAPAEGFHGKAEVHEKMEANSHRDLEQKSFSTWRFVLALLRHVPWLALRALGLITGASKL